MSDELEALLLERAALTLEELAAGCHAEVEWVVARVQAAVLHDDPPPDPELLSNLVFTKLIKRRPDRLCSPRFRL